jgi:predicted Fe-Mo cluster-binding NifX family protein
MYNPRCGMRRLPSLANDLSNCFANLPAAVRVLLDASIDGETLGRIRRIIERQLAVVEVRSLLGRNAGRYRFLEAQIGVRLQSVEKSHRISHAIEEEIRKELLFVERVLIHIEPVSRETVRITVPLTDQTGTVSQHFGLASYFALTKRQVDTGHILEQMIVANPFAGHPKGRGLEVAHWLLEQRVDVVITPDEIREKGPGHALGDAGVRVILSEATTLVQALEETPVVSGAEPAADKVS